MISYNFDFSMHLSALYHKCWLEKVFIGIFAPKIFFIHNRKKCTVTAQSGFQVTGCNAIQQKQWWLIT